MVLLSCLNILEQLPGLENINLDQVFKFAYDRGARVHSNRSDCCAAFELIVSSVGERRRTCTRVNVDKWTSLCGNTKSEFASFLFHHYVPDMPIFFASCND